VLTWLELAQLSDDELAARDIAETTLACAAGLPGAEGVEPAFCLDKLDRWAKQLRQFTASNWAIFNRQPSKYQDSKARFRMLCLVTFVQQHLGVLSHSKLGTHNKLQQNPPDHSDSRDQFIHGPLHGWGGTCATLPTLYAALGRRLGYPIRLARTTEHLFARWEKPGGERFNIECTVLGLDTPPDEYYLRWPRPADPEDVRLGQFLKTLTPREELAGELIQRAYCLRDNGRHEDAVTVCLWACAVAPAMKLHERTAKRMLFAWDDALRRLRPTLFPIVRIHPPAQRRFPDSVPWELELESLWLEAVDRLLHDPRAERDWWQPLRALPVLWPVGVPKTIDFPFGNRSRQKG
jgi:hypothetical protein